MKYLAWCGVAFLMSCSGNLGGGHVGPGGSTGSGGSGEAGVNDCDLADPNLAAAAEQEAMAGSVRVSQVTNLYATRVSTLEGVQCLRGLVGLAVQSDRDLDLSPLSGHPRLQTLNLQSVPLRSLSSLGQMPALAALYARDSKLVSLSSRNLQPKLATLEVGNTPVTTLAGLATWAPNLTQLYIDGTGVTSLAGIESLDRLTFVAIARTAISDLQPLAKLPISALSARQTHLIDLSPLTQLLALDFIDVAQTALTSIAPLSSTPVKRVYAEQSGLATLDSLRAFSSLRHIRLDGNAITDVSPLAMQSGPAWVELRGNPLDANAASILQSLCDRGWAADWDGGTCGNSCLFESCTLALD